MADRQRGRRGCRRPCNTSAWRVHSLRGSRSAPNTETDVSEGSTKSPSDDGRYTFSPKSLIINELGENVYRPSSEGDFVEPSETSVSVLGALRLPRRL